MAIKRQPTSIVVNGAYLQVKDPNAGATALFGKYRTVPGLGAFTLPAETGAVNETPLMDGTIGAAQFKGVGTITGAVGALGAHPTHQFLEDASLSGAQIQINIIRLATQVGVQAPGSNAVAAGTLRRIAITGAAARAWVKNNVLQGHLVAIDMDGEIAPTAVVSYKAAAASGTDEHFMAVMAVDGEGRYVDVAPGFSAAKATTGSSRLIVRNPGRSYTDITGVVNQWDAGDFQGGSNVSGNLTFTPTVALPAATPEFRLPLPSTGLPSGQNAAGYFDASDEGAEGNAA